MPLLIFLYLSLTSLMALVWYWGVTHTPSHIRFRWKAQFSCWDFYEKKKKKRLLMSAPALCTFTSALFSLFLLISLVWFTGDAYGEVRLTSCWGWQLGVSFLHTLNTRTHPSVRLCSFWKQLGANYWWDLNSLEDVTDSNTGWKMASNELVCICNVIVRQRR